MSVPWSPGVTARPPSTSDSSIWLQGPPLQDTDACSLTILTCLQKLAQLGPLTRGRRTLPARPPHCVPPPTAASHLHVQHEDPVASAHRSHLVVRAELHAPHLSQAGAQDEPTRVRPWWVGGGMQPLVGHQRQDCVSPGVSSRAGTCSRGD